MCAIMGDSRYCTTDQHNNVKQFFLQLKYRFKKKYFSEFCEPFWQIIEPERRGLEKPCSQTGQKGSTLRSASEADQSCGTGPIIRGMWAKPW